MEEEEKEAISPYMGPSHPIVINEVIEHFIRSISERLDEPTYGKLLRAIDFVNRENLKIIYRNNDGISPYIEILDETVTNLVDFLYVIFIQQAVVIYLFGWKINIRVKVYQDY